MQSKAQTPAEYIADLPEDKKPAIEALRKAMLKNLPKGFSEEMNYGMIGYVVPHKLYSAGYHCDPKLPLPFMNLAAQKNFIAVYHMGLFADKKLLAWFQKRYAEDCKFKLDMGKSCIRFKNLDQIPYSLIGELAGKMTVQDWISLYEKEVKTPRKKS